MTFDTRIATGQCALQYYATISGIPYVFSNLPIPSEWDEGGGTVEIDSETYTWSKTLELNDGISISQKMEPKAGIGVSGSLAFRFRLQGNQSTAYDTWLNLLAVSLGRDGGNVGILVESITDSSLVMVLDVNTGWPAPTSEFDTYVGLETIEVATRQPGSTFMLSTRGKYGSPESDHTADIVADSIGHGAYVTDHPTVWVGREIHLWCATGIINEAGDFEPYGAEIQSSEDLEIYAGIVTRLDWSSDQLSAIFQTSTLDKLMARTVGQRLPRACAGSYYEHQSGADHRFALDRDCSRLSWKWEPLSGTNSDHAYSHWGRECWDPEELDWIAGNRLYSLETYEIGGTTYSGITDILKATIWDHYSTPASLSGILNQAVTIWVDESNKIKIEVYALYSVSATEEWSLRLDGRLHDSILRPLGFTSLQTQPPEIYSSPSSWETMKWTFEADRPIPAFFLPAPDSNPIEDRRVWFQEPNGVPFAPSSGIERDDGDDVTEYVRIGKEICELTGKGTNYVTIHNRGQLGSGEMEHYVELKPGKAPKDEQITQGLSFDGVSVPRAMLYSMISGYSGSTSDYGPIWPGSGARIPESLVDITSFEDRATEQGFIGNNLAIFDEEKLSSVFRGELQLSRLCCIPANSSGEWVLSLQRVDPPLEAGLATFDITQSNSVDVTGAGIGFNTSESRIINKVIVQADYDNGTKQYNHTVTAFDQESIQTWGEQQPLELKLRSVKDTAPADDAVRDLATNRIFPMFARPYAIVEKQITTAQFWSVQLNDTLTLTDAILPLDSYGRVTTSRGGCTAVKAPLWAVSSMYPVRSGTGAVRAKATLVLPVDGGRRSYWSPTMRCTAAVTTTLTVSENYFSASGADADITHFDEGDKVILYLPGNRTGAQERAIVSKVSDTSLTVNTAPTLTPPFFIEPVMHDNDTVIYFPTVYMSDGSHSLEDSAATIYPPFSYV